jgi:hypothetical protein
MPTDWNMVIALVSLITSIVLSVVAIGMSLYFYTQGKNTESNVRAVLAEIKQQTDTLQKISGRQLDRLTRAVTESKPANEERQFLFIVEAMKHISATTAISPPPSPSELPADMRNWILLLSTDAYFHAAVSNCLLQGYLPDSIGDLADPLRRLVDLSCADFEILDGLLMEAAKDLTGNAEALYEEALTNWKPHVRDTLAVYKMRESQQPTAE